MKVSSTNLARLEAALSMCLVLAGCVTSRSSSAPTPIVLPDGSRGFTVHCAEQQGDASDCEAQAVKVCGGLYTVIDPAKGSDPTNSATIGQRASEMLVVKCVPP